MPNEINEPRSANNIAKMRILVISQYFHPENFRINDVVAGLRERGHSISVLAGTPNYPAGRFFDDHGLFKNTRSIFNGAEILRVPIIARGRGSRWQLAANYLSYAISASLLGPFLCRGKFDAILTYQMSPATVGFPALVMRKLKKIPMIFWVQDLWPESLIAVPGVRSKRIIAIVGRFMRLFYRNSDLILIQSRAFRPIVKKHCGDVANVRYLPNTAESFYDEVNVGPSEPVRQLLPQGFCIMFAGNISAAQDFETILQSAQLLRADTEIKWVIAGDGAQREWVEEEIKRRNLGDQVKLIGRHEPETMPKLFSIADALLITLKKDPAFELTIPSKLQSYMACGRPIVAALDGEPARLIEESGAGFVAPSESSKDLAAAVLRLYRLSSEERLKMGRAGRAYFLKHFGRDKLMESLIVWINDLVQRRPLTGETDEMLA